MLDVYSHYGVAAAPSIAMMKQYCSPATELFEFNLGRAPQLRCADGNRDGDCGSCESCQLTDKIKYVKEWFPRLGDQSKKRFMLGLVRRFHSIDLLHNVVSILQPLFFKDFTYARARPKPSLKTDVATVSADHALTVMMVESYINSTWDWFHKGNYWTKSNFVLALMPFCDAHLLYTIGIQAKTFLVSEEKAAISTSRDTEYTDTKVVDSVQFRSDERLDLQFLTSASTHYSRITEDPFSHEALDPYEDIVDNDSGDESLTDSSLSLLDPTCLVIPTSSKAYSGVSKHKDFIRCLPVHLAKYILSMLDRGSLNNTLCVSANWRVLAEEVHKEFFVQQQLWEEVMLMQGAAAQGVNAVYANDVDVPVPNIQPKSWEVIPSGDIIIKTTFKSEVNFETAYSGSSTRKVIMEERNVYCGSYNVMVISNLVDSNRVIHTGGKSLIAIGSHDRKVRFIDRVSGRQKGPLITGHAGSIRCVLLCEDEGIVLSGSYDTSIRCWSIETGQCLKILRGHRDTVTALEQMGDVVASGSKDGSCKIWSLQTGKCQRSFRHKHPVMAVAMSADICITGCEGGRVKVWDLKTGQLIKSLAGHHGALTSIRFDKWHIITGSRDGYALIWSAQGNHSRCLNALRHPKEVLCLEFMYLRVITGSADGRLRIWNMITGQCCRIMRGNSRSDPITYLVAHTDSITVNTNNNLLVLSFEPVEWDYSLPNDKVPPRVQYGSYSDAPVRQQPYPYVRAQRMLRAGATNSKIIAHDQKGDAVDSSSRMQMYYRANQIPHSAKSLSSRSLQSARLIQSLSAVDSDSSAKSIRSRSHATASGSESKISVHASKPCMSVDNDVRTAKKPPHAQKSSANRGRPSSGKSHVTVDSVNATDDRRPSEITRRVSWAFEKPLLPKSKDVTLSETKALLRSQIRAKENVIPPSFVYLTVNAIQNSMKPGLTNTNTINNARNISSYGKKLTRPSSSPSKIDPRTKVPLEDLDLDQFRTHVFDEDEESVSSEPKTDKIRDVYLDPNHGPTTEIYATRCIVTPVASVPHHSLHPKGLASTLPKGRVIRPHSASVTRKSPAPVDDQNQRPSTAGGLKRPGTAQTLSSSIAAVLPGAKRPTSQQRVHIAAAEANMVPMLMYPANMQQKLADLKLKRLAKCASATQLHQITPYNDPMRSHTKFELRTYGQEQKREENMRKMYENENILHENRLEMKRKAEWVAKAKCKV